MITAPSLKLTVRAFYDVQDLRKKAGNRIFGIQRDVGISEAEANWLTEKVFDRVHIVERSLFKDIAGEVRQHPLWEGWLQYVWGIGGTLAGALLGEVDISKFATPSKLRAYSGLHTINVCKEDGKTLRWFPTSGEAWEFVNHLVDLEQKTAEHWALLQNGKCYYDGERKRSEYVKKCVWGPSYEYENIGARRIAGLPDNCNPLLKTTWWKCGQQFMKGNPEKSKYRAFYDDAKKYYIDRDTEGQPKTKGTKKVYSRKDGGEISAGHINNRALRKTVKLFLSHYWVQARKFAGLPTVQEYVIEHLGHNDYIEPYFDKQPLTQ